MQTMRGTKPRVVMTGLGETAATIDVRDALLIAIGTSPERFQGRTERGPLAPSEQIAISLERPNAHPGHNRAASSDVTNHVPRCNQLRYKSIFYRKSAHFLKLFSRSSPVMSPIRCSALLGCFWNALNVTQSASVRWITIR